MTGMMIGPSGLKRRAGLSAAFPILAMASCLLSGGYAMAADAGALQFNSELRRLLDESDKAASAGNQNLALIQLKNAVRLAPNNGETRARLGVALLGSGDLVAAERELRQARSDDGPYDVVVPAILTTMLRRGETRELLAEFPDPSQGTQDKTAPDILAARAMALQISAQPKEARQAMDRSLSLRRDGDGLAASARLATLQGDIALARTHTDEAIKLSPNNEEALSNGVLYARDSGDTQNALVRADELVRRVPGSSFARVLRLEILLELGQDARAQQEVDALLKQQPKSTYGHYVHASLLARKKDYKNAWIEMQTLPTTFVLSEAPIAISVARIAAVSGNAETGGGILTSFLARRPNDANARLQLAAIRLSQNAPTAALNTLAPLKTSSEPVVQAVLAQAYMGLHRFDDAVASLKIANSAPSASDLLKRQLALAQLEVGDSDQASQSLRTLVQRDPSNAEFAGPLITALMTASKWDEAMGVADAMAKQQPKSAVPVFYRGQIFLARGNLSGATAEYTQALALDPKYLAALYYRADVSVARGNPADAKKDLNLVLAQNPSDMLAYTKLMQIAWDNGQDQEALGLFERAIKAAPNEPAPRLALANHQIDRGKYQDAQTTVNGLLQVSQRNPAGMALLGRIQALRGQPAESVNTFRALVASNNSSPVAYGLLAKALYATNDQLGAEEAAKRAVELKPESVEARSDLIDIQVGGDKPDAALATARAYGNAFPGMDADLLMANAYLQMKRPNDAVALLEKVAKPDARSTLLLSEITAKSGDFKKASTVLSNWSAKNPANYAMRREYATSLTAAGDPAGARKEYESLLKLRPEDPVVLNNLSLLVQKDDPGRAIALVSLAAKIAPNSPEIADTLGWMKYQRQDHQGALPLLQRAHDLSADNAPVAYHLALALDASGRHAEAKTLLQATVAKYPKFDGVDDAKKVLARW